MDIPKELNSACVLVSGGADSAVLLDDALTRYDTVFPLYIRNHLRWEETEIYWLKKLLRELKSPRLKVLRILDVPMRDLYEAHWSLTGIHVPGRASRDESVYLPGRNIIFLSKAAVFAAMNDIPVIEIGVLKGNPFSDSSTAFFAKLAEVLSVGLGRAIEVRAPFRRLKKEAVLEKGKRLPLDLTFSCINPKGYDHCGDCNKCMERKRAFFAAGIFDRTKYKKTGL